MNCIARCSGLHRYAPKKKTPGQETWETKDLRIFIVQPHSVQVVLKSPSLLLCTFDIWKPDTPGCTTSRLPSVKYQTHWLIPYRLPCCLASVYIYILTKRLTGYWLYCTRTGIRTGVKPWRTWKRTARSFSSSVSTVIPSVPSSSSWEPMECDNHISENHPLDSGVALYTVLFTLREDSNAPWPICCMTRSKNIKIQI